MNRRTRPGCRARAALLALSIGGLTAAGPLAGQEATTILLVRHAEKAEAPAADPPLTPRGAERADALAEALRDLDLTAVYSTDYLRTQHTAAPVARLLGLDVQSYDPRALGDFAEALREAGGRVLVVGHSNTTPQLVQLLGGEPGPAIVEATEYDRLYLLTVSGDGGVSTSMLRYGGRDR